MVPSSATTHRVVWWKLCSDFATLLWGKAPADGKISPTLLYTSIHTLGDIGGGKAYHLTNFFQPLSLTGGENRLDIARLLARDETSQGILSQMELTISSPLQQLPSKFDCS